ncbi:hypothetical protein [Chamaesiphon sp. GL140_3_metabinner_50]|nr:hypothetical protein [Chamaesiphon sp. GL140_3_metabinner_50]
MQLSLESGTNREQSGSKSNKIIKFTTLATVKLIISSSVDSQGLGT